MTMTAPLSAVRMTLSWSLLSSANAWISCLVMLLVVIHLMNTPDEALVETRQKLVIKRKIWFYLEKMKTLLVHLDYDK